MKGKTTIILSVAALVFALCAIAISIVRVPEMKIDVFSGLVGLLSILVVVLIGWQVYLAIDLDKKIRIVQKEYENIKIALSESNKAFVGNMSMQMLTIYGTLMSKPDRSFVIYQMFSHTLLIIKNMDADTSEKAILTTMNIIADIQTIPIRKEDKTKLIRQLSGISNTDNVTNYNYFLEFLYQYPVND